MQFLHADDYSAAVEAALTARARGIYNIAEGNYSFAAGRRAMATFQGCFVWGDSTELANSVSLPEPSTPTSE